MVLLDNDFDTLTDLIEHGCKIASDLVVRHVNRSHTFDDSGLRVGSVAFGL